MDQVSMRHVLKPHMSARPDGVGQVSCAVRWRDAGCWTLDFHVGETRGLSVPVAQSPARADGLWQTTCFELFLRRQGYDDYLEFNFSPSGQWAAYRFDGYRRGGVDLETEPPVIHRSDNDHVGLALQARFDGDAFAIQGPWLAALSAVIEETNGRKSYWALSHPSERPDFHHPDSFVLELP